MKRKVIQLAGKTAVISLPSRWVRKNSIQKGDELEIEEGEKKLTILTDNELRTEKQEIDTKKGYDPLCIAYMYQAGVDEIRINYANADIYKDIKKKLPDLMGYEIIDQQEKSLEIKNVSEVLEEEFETILRRIFHIMEEWGKNILEASTAEEYKRLEGLQLIENSIDKFTDFCKRVLNKKSHKENKNQFYYTIVRDIEKIGDLYEDIIDTLLEEKQKPAPKTIEMLKETNDFFKSFREVFYRFNEENTKKFMRMKKDINKKGREKLKTKEDVLLVHNLTIMSKTIAELYGPLYIAKKL